MNDDIFNFLDDIMLMAKKRGASSSEVVFGKSLNQQQQVRMGNIEEAEGAEDEGLGIKIRIGQKESAITSNAKTIKEVEPLLDKLFAMAPHLPDNPYLAEATPEQLYKKNGKQDLETFDDTILSVAQMQQIAKDLEDSARQQKNIVNSEGSSMSFGHHYHWFVFSNGFRGKEAHSSYSMGVAIIAGDDKGMEVDYDYSSKVFFSDLMPAEALGKSAAERAARHLGAIQEKSGNYPVVLEPRIATNMLGNLARAINGASLAKGTSFLTDCLGKKIMSDTMTIVDDPFQKRGFASQLHDGEGLPCQKRHIVDKGVLTTYILDLASAKQLNLPPTAHASRSGVYVSPSLTNAHLMAGTLSPQELMADIKDGFYVTSVMGFGVNGVTGDYSQGASGFWIKNGVISHPVNEMTIAGNLKDMFMAMTPANDLVFTYHHNAPTLRIDGMTIAGK